jgi:hypothetical protein
LPSPATYTDPLSWWAMPLWSWRPCLHVTYTPPKQMTGWQQLGLGNSRPEHVQGSDGIKTHRRRGRQQQLRLKSCGLRALKPRGYYCLGRLSHGVHAAMCGGYAYAPVHKECSQPGVVITCRVTRNNSHLTQRNNKTVWVYKRCPLTLGTNDFELTRPTANGLLDCWAWRAPSP